MKSKHSKSSGRRPGRGSRRPSRGREQSRPAALPVKTSFWQKLVAFFTGNSPAKLRRPAAVQTPAKSSRKADAVDVTTPKLYVGNLSFDATESDLSELFNGVGTVRSAEVVAHRDTQKSKGFGFVLLTTIEEAKRAVAELHDRDFLGRKLVVSGAKTSDRQSDYRR